MEGKKQVLLDQISYAQQLGGNTYDLHIKLDQLTESLKPQPTLWGTLQGAMKDVGGEMKTGLGTAFGDVLFNIGKVGQDFATLGENMVKTITDKIIALGVKKLFDSLASIADGTGPIAAIGKALGGLTIPSVSATTPTFTGGPATFGTYDNPTAGAPGIGAAGSAASTAASAGGAAASTGTSLLTSLGSIGSIVGAVADVGAGITAGLQASTTNDHLFHIMSDTAWIKGGMFQSDGLLWAAKDAALSLETIISRLDNAIHPDLASILGELQDGVHAQLTQFYTDSIALSKQMVTLLTAPVPAQKAAPSVSVVVQGNVIGIQDFVDQVITGTANRLRLQGVPA